MESFPALRLTLVLEKIVQNFPYKWTHLSTHLFPRNVKLFDGNVRLHRETFSVVTAEIYEAIYVLYSLAYFG